MKKSVFTLFALLVCILSPIQAYEYFTIYFSDGTKSEAFYATDVDSICYSKIGIDSILYANWQVQEIYTCDSVYRYPLSQIDSLSFKDVDEQKLVDDIASVTDIVSTYYDSCDSPVKLSHYLQAIREIEYVENAYIEGQTLFVKVNDGYSISFIYPLEDADNDEDWVLPLISNNARRNANQPISEEHQYSEAKRACIVNQQFRDQNRADFIKTAESLNEGFLYMGMDTCIINMPNPDFFKKEIFDYDLIFIKAHGCCDTIENLHWIATGEELCNYNPKEKSFGYIDSLLFLRLPTWIHHGFSPKRVGFMMVKEMRDGVLTNVYYTKISDEYIRSSSHSFKNSGSAILFNSACESMKNNPNFAEAFRVKGLGCYLGYNDPDRAGGVAGKKFFVHLLAGKSVIGAKNALPDWCQDEIIFVDKNGYAYDAEPSGITTTKYNPVLKVYPENSNLRIYHPETGDYEYLSANNSFLLKGQMKLFGIFQQVLTGYKYGFLVADNPDMSQPDTVKAEGNYDSSTLYMSWEKTLDESDLEPKTTYYYRAYMNDGYSNCYGETKQFTTSDNTSSDNAEPYCVLKDSVLTFYYDDHKEIRDGKVYDVYEHYQNLTWPEWSYYFREITEADFDVSFTNYKPTSTARWFYFQNNLKKIHNIERLNTSIVRDMNIMFRDCTNLDSLDLSNFDTSNVTNMGGMFYGCDNLKNLDISHFNTSKVTTMKAFLYGCKTLEKIDVSNFDTSNVTNMQVMFAGCKSLISLDVSNFITENVTDMNGMFSGCSSLTAIDVSNFNVNKVGFGYTGYMFSGCSQLKTIYACWERGAGSDEMMFYGCDNLVGGAGTKCLYGYGIYNQPLYLDSSLWARVDGGKDRMGLFTAK